MGKSTKGSSQRVPTLSDRLRFKAELIARDPLRRELVENPQPGPLPALPPPNADPAEIAAYTASKKGWAKYVQSRRSLAERYGLTWVDVESDPEVLGEGLRFTIRVHGDEGMLQLLVNNGCATGGLADRLELAVRGEGVAARIGANTACAHGSERTEERPGYHEFPCLGLDGVDLGQAHSVSVTVNLAEVTKWNLDKLGRDFKAIVRQALRESPYSPAKARRMQEPPPLHFLRTVTPDQFYRDLKRYDLWAKYRLPFRLIAFFENKEKQGEAIPSPPRRKKLGFSVPGEDAVEKSVQRIFRAIHRKELRCRPSLLRDILEIESPAEYRCGTHRNTEQCTEECAQDWMAQFDATLPPLGGVRREGGPRFGPNTRSRERTPAEEAKRLPAK
jgi:hypothetical protein